MRKPAHPGLYDVDDAVSLNGTRCRQCGTAFFPALRIGCEVCGAPDEDLENARLAARGHVHASATVHMHRDAPFTVAEVVLDDGPIVRGLMATNDEVSVGDRVAAHWFVTKTGDDGNEIVEPRFAAVG